MRKLLTTRFFYATLRLIKQLYNLIKPMIKSSKLALFLFRERGRVKTAMGKQAEWTYEGRRKGFYPSSD